jgi:hypothetical protein
MLDFRCAPKRYVPKAGGALFLLAAVWLFAGIAPRIDAARLPQTVWSASHPGLSNAEWYRPGGANFGGGEFNSGCAEIAPSQDVARSGSFSLRLTIRTPCASAPESGARMFRWLEPQMHPDLYYRVWYYFPRAYTVTGSGTGDEDSFWNILQWKSSSTAPPANDPFFSVNVGNRRDGRMYLYLYDSNTRTHHGQDLANVPVGEWFLIAALYESRGDESGQVRIWQNDTLLWSLTGVQTRYPDSAGGSTTWSVNSYSNGVDPEVASFYIDDVEIQLP